MTKRALVVALFGLATITAACGKKQPDVVPTPANNSSASTDADRNARAAADSARARFLRDSLANLNNSARNNETDRASIVNRLSATIHFEYDQSTIRDDDAALMADKVAIMRTNPGLRIRITGHADDRGSREYNLALGMRRATAARDYLVRAGIEASRIEIASLGSEVPVDPSQSEEAYAKNRRDEFDAIAGAQNLVNPR